MSVYLKYMDPKELENRIQKEVKTKLDDNFPYSFKDLEPYLTFLPKKEYDLILMYYVLKKEQKQIAKILRLTQGGVSHRLSRAKARLKFLVNVPKFTKENLFSELKEIFNELDLKILWGLYTTTCQSVVAKQVNMTQSRIRHRFMKNLDVLERYKNEKILKKYYDAFKLISQNNFNILREILLPKWASKNSSYIDRPNHN